MRTRIASICAVIIALGLLPGCPGNSLVGTWILTRGDNAYGLELMPNGSVVAFASPSLLFGTLTWEVNGSEFILSDETAVGDIIFVGRVSGDSSISGGWVAWTGVGTGNGGDWSAVKQ